MAQRVIVEKFSSDGLPKRCFISFAELRSRKQFCDITLSVGELSIHAHRVILAGAIPYFRNIFVNRLEVRDIEPNILACLIDYAYTHELSIDTNNARSLFDAARKYGIDEVQQACYNFLLDVEPETVRNDQELASRFAGSMRLDETDRSTRDSFVVTSKENFLDCPVTDLKHSTDKDPNVEKEEVLGDVSCSKDCPVTDLKHSADKDPNVEKEEVLDDVSYSKDSAEDRNKGLPEVMSEVAIYCSYKIRPSKVKRKEEGSSNEKVEKLCIFKLNATETYSFQRFDVLKEQWITENPKTFLTFSGLSVPFQNKVYIFGLAPTLQYDPSDNSFESMSWIPTSRDFFGATALKNSIFICGGRLHNFTATNVVECFHPAADAWKIVSPMRTDRFGLSVVTLNECIFAIGGICGNIVHSSVEKYDPKRGVWTFMSPMEHRRWAAGAAAFNGRIYVCGGKTLNEAISSCEMYLPTDDQWVYVSPLTLERCFFSLLPFQEKLYAIGGYSADEQDLHFFDVYEPRHAEWKLGPWTDRGLVTSSAVVVPVVDA